MDSVGSGMKEPSRGSVRLETEEKKLEKALNDPVFQAFCKRMREIEIYEAEHQEKLRKAVEDPMFKLYCEKARETGKHEEDHQEKLRKAVDDPMFKLYCEKARATEKAELEDASIGTRIEKLLYGSRGRKSRSEKELQKQLSDRRLIEKMALDEKRRLELQHLEILAEGGVWSFN